MRSGVYGSIAIVYVMRIGLIAIDGCFGSAIASIIDIVRVADGARGDVDPRIDPIELAHPNRGCRSWGLKPPVSSRLRAM